jgi:cytidyltransferase-like protein
MTAFGRLVPGDCPLDRPLVLVSGCFDVLHSGHVAFLQEAAKFGNLIVSLGSDETIARLKGRKPLIPAIERLYVVQALACVHTALIASGHGLLDFEAELREIRPQFFVVNKDGDHPEKRALCKNLGIEYVVLERRPHPGLMARTSSALRSCIGIPLRLDVAGGWLDQPFVSNLHPGAVIVISIEMSFVAMPRSGLATSTRTTAQWLWDGELPDMPEEKAAKILFAQENFPGCEEISGSQDALGICMPGATRLEYNGDYWPDVILSLTDDDHLTWIESLLKLKPLWPRPASWSVWEGHRENEADAKCLAIAADECWSAIEAKDAVRFGRAMSATLDAQRRMFPAMVPDEVQQEIYRLPKDVHGCKLAGAGGGGYLIVCSERAPQGCLPVKVRRSTIRPA